MLKSKSGIVWLSLVACLTAATAFGESAVSGGDANLRGSLDPSAQAEPTIAQDANLWGLSSSEYQKYLNEMNQEGPSSYWWKNVDPPQVLGMNAKTEEERIKYVKIFAALDHDRVTRELAFEKDYQKVRKEMYPNEKPIDDGETS